MTQKKGDPFSVTRHLRVKKTGRGKSKDIVRVTSTTVQGHVFDDIGRDIFDGVDSHCFFLFESVRTEGEERKGTRN